LGKLDSGSSISAARAGAFARYAAYLESQGVAVGRLLANAKIPPWLLDHPDALVPLDNAIRFVELGCRALGTEHLGVHVALGTSLQQFGAYGRALERSVTIYDYLRRGASHYNTQVTGQHLWLSDHGSELRLNVGTASATGLGAFQSHLSTLTITIISLRKVDPEWSPREMGLAYRTREALPMIGCYANSRLSRESTVSYITIPRALAGLSFAARIRGRAADPQWSSGGRSLPGGLCDVVEHQIKALISDGTPHIDTLAESLCVSPRSLQRGLAKHQSTYSQLLAEARMTMASEWLESTDKPITEIAFDLGYADASNFTRAFRWTAGLSPQKFRNANRVQAAGS